MRGVTGGEFNGGLPRPWGGGGALVVRCRAGAVGRFRAASLLECKR